MLPARNVCSGEYFIHLFSYGIYIIRCLELSNKLGGFFFFFWVQNYYNAYGGQDFPGHYVFGSPNEVYFGCHPMFALPGDESSPRTNPKSTENPFHLHVSQQYRTETGMVNANQNMHLSHQILCKALGDTTDAQHHMLTENVLQKHVIHKKDPIFIDSESCGAQHRQCCFKHFICLTIEYFVTSLLLVF